MKSDGTFDSSFSGNGIARTSFPNGPSSAYDVAVQADGKVVAAGDVQSDSRKRGLARDFGLVRYTRRGELDRTFSGDGKKRTDCGGDQDHVRGLALQPNGRIVVVGSTAPAGQDDEPVFALARYRANGSLDTTFSRNGRKRTRFGPDARDSAFDAAVQPDGRILAAGSVSLGAGGLALGLARYLPR